MDFNTRMALQQQAGLADAAYAGNGALVGGDSGNILVRILNRSQKHVTEINELATNVCHLADQVFGPEPAAEKTAGGGGYAGQSANQLKSATIPEIDRAQFLIDEAMETLRRQLARFGNL